MTERAGLRRTGSQAATPQPEAAAADASALRRTTAPSALPGLARGTSDPGDVRAGGEATGATGAPGAVRRTTAPAKADDSIDNYKKPLWQRMGRGKDKYAGTPSGKFSADSPETKRGAVAATKAGEQEAYEQEEEESRQKGLDPKKKKNTPHQPVADLGEIYAHSGMLKAEYEHQVQQIAQATNGQTKFRPGEGMKSIGRTLEKIVAEYKGDASRIVDVTGGSIYYDSPDDLISGFKALQGNDFLKLVRVKNSLKNADGYGDINLSVEMGGADLDVPQPDGTTKTEHYDGFIIELQLHLSPIIEIKEVAHKQYEEQRTIAARNSKKKKENWSTKDRSRFDALNAEMKAMYRKGWEKCVSKDDFDNPEVTDKLASLREKLAVAIPEK
jgi:hypothetical protein